MENASGFISILMSAVSNCMLYSKNHSSVDELIDKAFSMLAGILKKTGAFEMMIIENDLVINRTPVREIGFQGQNLIKRLRRKGVSHISFSGGLALAEFKNLVADISTAEKGLKASAHIKVGVVNVLSGGIKGFSAPERLMNRRADIQNISAYTTEQIEKAKEEYSRISPFRQLNIAGFDEIVGQFVLTLKKEVNVIKLLKPARSNMKQYETHAANVSVLTIFQAQSLGIREELHGDIGLAALLHDVGKLMIPRERLEKETSPGGKEKLINDLHPLYGAQYLAKIDALPRLAPVVAFEHHLRYDGQGYPELRSKNIKQHICSQMTAISDAFDNLRIVNPQQGPLDYKEILAAMKTKDEGLFNPFLIDNFIRSIHLALSG